MKTINKDNKGFTLIELLVVVAIIGLLSSVVLASLNSVRGKARDAKRKEDIVQIRTALEMYYNDHGSYPLPNPTRWSGVSSGAGVCGSGNSDLYIDGLVPTYMSVLPVDPTDLGPESCSGYLYGSDGDGYKLLVKDTPESYHPTEGQPFYDPDPVRSGSSWMICSGEPACSW